MFVTRATRHDHADIRALLAGPGWDRDVTEGVTFIARDGPVVGCVRLVEVEPQVVVVDVVLVHEDRRGEGIGRRLMSTAMSARGGTLYLCCHENRLAFYRHLGFQQVPFDALPATVAAYFERVGDHPAEPGHPQHYFLKAR